MAKKCKSFSGKIVIIAVFFIFLGITIFANMLGPSLPALSSTLTDLSFTVSVDDFSYLSGALLRKSDGDLPVFQLTFNTVTIPHLRDQYGDSLFLEYATSAVVLENIEEGAADLDWHKISRYSANEKEYFDVDEKTAFLGIERLVEIFENIEGNENKQSYREILYFRAVEDFGEGEAFFYDVSQVWDIRVDLVDLTHKDKYQLNITPYGFSPSIVTFFKKLQEGESFGLNLSFRSESTQNNISNMDFYFAVLDDYQINVAEIIDWRSLDDFAPNPNDVDRDNPQLELASYDKGINNQLFNIIDSLNIKYFYFKVVDTVSGGGGQPVEYIHTMPVEVMVDTGDYGYLEFEEIWAVDKSSGATYSLDNPIPGTWSKSGIEVNVRLTEDTGAAEVYFEFLRGNLINKHANFTYDASKGAYTLDFVADNYEDDNNRIVSSYSGSIRLVAHSSAGETININKYVYIDRTTPSLNISAKTVSGKDYNLSDSWASEDIIFSIPDIDSPISGVQYSYLREDGWRELERVGDARILRVDRTSTIYFRAITGAGYEVQEEVRARIDTKKPNLKIVATETGVSGKEILTNDYVLGTGETLGNRRIGYAQDKIRFVLSNTTIQDEGANTITYSYKKNGEPDSAYRIIARQGGIYVLEVSLNGASSLELDYFFKVEAKTGLNEVKRFKATILQSNFTVNMNIDFSNLVPVESLVGEVLTDTDEVIEWYNEEIPVEFILKDNLGSLDTSQYRIFSYERGSESNAIQMTMERFTGVPEGKIGLRGYINRNVKGKIIEFYVLDKADNKVYFNASTQENMMTPPLFLDLMAPTATVERFIVGGSNIKLDPDDWAKGKVNIHLRVPVAAGLYPISGVACFEVVNGVELGQPMEGRLIENNTIFLYEIQKEISGNYEFKLRSGSGIDKSIAVRVDIDTTDIELYNIFAKTISDDGTVTEISIDGTETVSSTVRIEFETNHQSHFYYQYIEYQEDFTNPTEVSGLIDLDYFNVYLNNEAGYKNYGFRLISKARNQDGVRSTTGEVFYLVSIKYDIRDFEIKASFNAPSGWSLDPISITLSADLSEEVFKDVLISKYQIKLDPSSVPSGTAVDWVDIVNIDGSPINLTDSDFGLSYLFPGIKWYFNEREKALDIQSSGVIDIGKLYGNLTDNQKRFASYNGKIYFRAISYSGKASGILTVEIKQDTSTPDPIYALYQSVGEVETMLSGDYISYSIDSFAYSRPENFTKYVNIFTSKAPIKYYYMDASLSVDPPESLDDSNWVALDVNNKGSYVLDKKQYWIAAAIAGDNEGIVRKLNLNKQATDKGLKIEFYEAINGNIVDQASNTYLFSWVDLAGISVRVRSESKISFWYKIGNGEWLPYFDGAKDPGNNYDAKIFTYIFVGDSGDIGDWGYAEILNIKANIKLKVTNQAGDSKELAMVFTVQIDSNPPVLEDNIFLTTLSGKSLSLEDIENNWINEDVIILIGENFNASGVEYSYRVSGEANFVPIGNNKSLSTGHIVSFPAEGGIITITIQAKQSAHGYSVQKILTLKIDKVTPAFDLSGAAYRRVGEGENTSEEQIGASLSTRQWTNADVVKVSIKPNNLHVPKSPVTYTRWDKNDQTWKVINPNDIMQVESQQEVIIRCITEAMRNAGKPAVEKNFVVNIDKTPPFIDAGPIINAPAPTAGEAPKYYEYYIDQKIIYIEDNLAKAEYNGYPLPQGHVIATNTVDNSAPYVHIIIEDKAGNKTELRFIMRPFPLTPAGEETGITLSQEHRDLLKEFERQFNYALTVPGGLTPAREGYFRMQIARLKDRVATMEKQIEDYQKFLRMVEENSTFELQSDYARMKSYWDKFYSGDPIVLYPKWQQDQIIEGNENRFEKFKTEFAILNDKMRVVLAVEKKISLLPAINVIKASDYGRVLAEYATYEELSNDQKAVFNANLKNKISELKRLCEVYRLQDEVTNVKISGDTLVAENPGATLKVETLGKDTGVFEQAQMTLLQTVDSTKARNIVAMHTLTLGGLGSTKNLGEMVITFEIPEEYTRYKLFSVYRRTADGTLTLMENIERSPDGKSVFFSANELGTYVLANAANVQTRDEASKVYGTFAGIEVDVVILNYITYTVLALFGIFIIVIIIVGVRRRKFLSKYNRAHKSALMRRGIDNIPKGNPDPASNPARPEERVPQSEIITFDKKKN